MTATTPLLSVIVPCYNASRFIRETVMSVLGQSYAHLELWVINDGSTDDSVDVLFDIKDPRLKVVHKGNSGVSDTRNTGIGLATGEYIHFLDSDDLLSPDFYTEILRQMESDPDLAVCGASVVQIDSEGNSLPGDYRPASGKLIADVLTNDPSVNTCPSAYVYRKSFIERFKLRFSRDLFNAADRFFLIQLSLAGGTGKWVEGATMFYRVHQQSMSRKITPMLIRDRLHYLSLLRQLPEAGPYINRAFLSRNYYTIAAEFFHLRRYGQSIKYMIISFLFHPVNFFNTMLRIQRRSGNVLTE